MQVLKEEVKNAIIKQAINEFYIRGYEKSSLRKIVKDAGTTIGNFYNYFKNKEDLYYSITSPVYDKLIYFIKNHNNDNYSEIKKITKIDIVYFRKVINDLFNDIDISFEQKLIILLDSSKGTKYSNIKKDIIIFLSEHFEEHITEYKINMNKKFSEIIAISFLEGLISILRLEIPIEEKQKIFFDFTLFYIFGGTNLLKIVE